ncbi:hypothetical protein Q7C36_004492 [Tachysurus vachellii]|uniref:Interferon-induced very large GTPase 1 domain-containing protein n=1 Tax=Tachysurus vachellii TaxID=175792 RepID=A0AA88T2Q8_TACVA|nr:hypothetical protein Q7C36_004492 [Tachysurus vachellii]
MIVLENLNKYYEQTEGHVYLVEKYKEDFVNSAKSLRRETENSVLNKLEAESEEKLDKIFENIWEETVQDLSFTGLPRRIIPDSVCRQLRLNMNHKGSSVSEKLNKVNLDQYGKEEFVVTADNLFKKAIEIIYKFEQTVRLQQLADSAIDACMQSINDKKERKSDYHDTYIQEILHIIDTKLTSLKKLKVSDEFELSLKLHICAISAREFQAMHDRFIEENDPRRCLEQSKEKYRADFKDLFSNRDQCQRKAAEFAQLCLSPAVETFICNSLGPDIIDTMLQGEHAFKFSTRSYFQCSILKQLLDDSHFENYMSYISSYERFVKEWILKQIEDRFSKGNKLFELEEQHLKGAIMEIKEAIRKAQQETDEDENIKGFIQNICRELGKKLVIPKDVLEAIMVLNNAKQEQFSCWLMQSVEDMQKSLKTKFKTENILGKLKTLKVKPQDELFKRVHSAKHHVRQEEKLIHITVLLYTDLKDLGYTGISTL